MNAPPSARSLHLYASALVARRPFAHAADAHAPGRLARAVRQVAAGVLRCGFPEAARWRSLPSPGEAPDEEAFREPGQEWVRAVDAALRAVAALDGRAAGDAAAVLSGLAEGARLPLAAALMAEAAALCALDDPERALRVATLARDRADHPAAEWWGKRAAMLAERVGAWRTAVMAWARVAEALCECGEYNKALYAHGQEIRLIRLLGSESLYAETLHTIAGVLWLAGKRERAKDALRQACELYSGTHPRLPALAHDAAYMRMEEGDATGAVPLLRWVLGSLGSARERVTTAVHLARAGAMTRDRSAFSDGIAEALNALEQSGHGDGAAWAFAELSRIAAECTGDFTRARKWALWALELAEQRGERGPARTARSVLDMVGTQ